MTIVSAGVQKLISPPGLMYQSAVETARAIAKVQQLDGTKKRE